MNKRNGTKEIMTPKRALLRLHRIQAYITEHLAADLHASVVAAQFKMSVSSLQHIFKKQLGISFHRYVESIRLDLARDLLQAGNLTVKEVMYATGYRNRKTFSNAFKNWGRVPAHFKQ